MSTTKYVTTDSTGNVNLLARAVDPNGNPITQTISITVNPLPIVPKCYNAILALSSVQDSVESACAQFGVANTYYLGNPRNTVYLDDSCSQLARDGFYKTEDNNYVNINGGAIRQRGSCLSIAVRNISENLGGARIATPPGSGPQQFETARARLSELQVGGVTNVAPPISIRIPGETREIFVPQPTFTAPAPTVVKPDTAFIPERAAFKAAQRIARVEQPVTTETYSSILTSTVDQL